MTKNIFGLGSVLLFGTAHGIRPSKEGFPGPISISTQRREFKVEILNQIKNQESLKKSLYARESDSNNGYNGRFWTGWSEWYGCPSFEPIQLNPFGPNAFDRQYFLCRGNSVMTQLGQVTLHNSQRNVTCLGSSESEHSGAVIPVVPFNSNS